MADMNIPDATVLEFHTEDALTTVLRESGSAAAAAPAYTITRSRDLKTTQLRAGGAETPVAELVFRDILPDTVALRGAPAGRLGAWLHSRNRFPASFEAGGARYVWTRDPNDRWMALARADDGAHVARWEAKSLVNGTPERVALARAAAAVHTDVLAALLVLLADAKARGVPVYGAFTVTPIGVRT